jgi:hypothetical protein
MSLWTTETRMAGGAGLVPGSPQLLSSLCLKCYFNGGNAIHAFNRTSFVLGRSPDHQRSPKRLHQPWIAPRRSPGSSPASSIQESLLIREQTLDCPKRAVRGETAARF